jgi:hypothetical protein
VSRRILASPFLKTSGILKKEKVMKTLKTVVVLSISIMLCGGASAQQSTAPTVTFNVPLQFSDLHQDVQHVNIACTVYDANGVIVGQGTALMTPTNGSINQTVTIVANQMPERDITLGTRYAAAMSLVVPPNTSVIPSQHPSTPVEYRA